MKQISRNINIYQVSLLGTMLTVWKKYLDYSFIEKKCLHTSSWDSWMCEGRNWSNVLSLNRLQLAFLGHYLYKCFKIQKIILQLFLSQLLYAKSSSSSSFIIPSFPLLGLDVIWVASTVVYLLPYLPWYLISSCLLPLPYSRSSLA